MRFQKRNCICKVPDQDKAKLAILQNGRQQIVDYGAAKQKEAQTRLF
jgi:hypothetical protein